MNNIVFNRTTVSIVIYLAIMGLILSSASEENEVISSIKFSLSAIIFIIYLVYCSILHMFCDMAEATVYEIMGDKNADKVFISDIRGIHLMDSKGTKGYSLCGHDFRIDDPLEYSVVTNDKDKVVTCPKCAEIVELSKGVFIDYR